MSDKSLVNDLTSFRLDNSYGVKVLKPLKRHYGTYRDEFAENVIDLNYSAVAQPVIWGDGKQFEQTMRVCGEFTLERRAL